MNRLAVGAFFAIFATGTARAQATNWELAGVAPDGNSAYINNATLVSHNGRIYSWTLINLALPASNPSRGMTSPWRSGLAHLAFDCAAGTYEVKIERYFGDPNAGGQQLYYRQSESTPITNRGVELAPDSQLAAILMATSCAKSNVYSGVPVNYQPVSLPLKVPPSAASSSNSTQTAPTPAGRSAATDITQVPISGSGEVTGQALPTDERSPQLVQVYESLTQQARKGKM